MSVVETTIRKLCKIDEDAYGVSYTEEEIQSILSSLAPYAERAHVSADKIYLKAQEL